MRVVHALTREADLGRFGGETRKGRVSAALLRELIPDPSACVVYACGPAISNWDRQAAREAGTEAAPRFMESVLAALKEIGVPNDRVKRESYG